MTDAQLRDDIKRRVDLMGGMALRILGRKAGSIPGDYVKSDDAGKPFTPVWDQDDHASNVTGMAE